LPTGQISAKLVVTFAATIYAGPERIFGRDSGKDKGLMYNVWFGFSCWPIYWMYGWHGYYVVDVYC